MEQLLIQAILTINLGLNAIVVLIYLRTYTKKVLFECLVYSAMLVYTLIQYETLMQGEFNFLYLMALLWFANMIYRYFQDDVKWSNTVGVDTVLMRFYKYTNKQPTVVLDYDGVILYVNRAFAEKLKYTKLDLIGKNYTKFLVGEYIAESAEVWNEGKDIVVLKDYKNEYYDSEGNKVEMHWEVCINYNNFKKSVCRLKE